MKILVVCMLHAYGDPKREYSYEYFNFYLSLKKMGHEVEIFDYLGEIQALGKDGMNQKLLDRVKASMPAMTMFSLYTDQFEPIVIDKLRKFTKTLCFFHDDTWRVEYSRYWAQYFDFFTTPDVNGELKYSEIGLSNAIYFPFGCNQNIFQRLDCEKKYDVSFVGGWHPFRQWVIDRLKKNGIEVNVFGYGWPCGELGQHEMVRVFNESRINLNLSNSASWDFRYLISSPSAVINKIRSKKNIEQMKARVFEINGCGGFQLTYYVEGLSNCYDMDREIAVYSDVDDLSQKINFYLAHDTLRESIADAGFRRTVSQHQFDRRFNEVFTRMRLD